MHATSVSDRPYFPYLLSNGNDAVLINYTGGMIQNLAGHAHDEQNQGAICAWHKAAHRAHGYVKPIVSFGFNVHINGEFNEIYDYDQHFDAPAATLRTTATYWHGTVFDIETYLTQNGVLVEHIKLLSTSASSLALVPTLAAPNAHNAGFAAHEATHITWRDGTLAFFYNLDGNAGGGTLHCSRQDGHPAEPGSDRQRSLRFDNLTPGWEATFFLTCADDSEEAVTDFDGLRERHLAFWHAHFCASSVTLPDSTLQYAYGLARYVVATAQHPLTGAIHVGIPHFLWSGGTCCPYDAEIIQRAMLMGNNLDAAARHIGFYLERYDAGCELAKSLGLKGFAISNWSDVFGSHKSQDIRRELLYRKPLMIAIIGIAAATTRAFSGDANGDFAKLALACADFIESGFIRDSRHIIQCAAGNESEIAVDRDSFMLMLCINLFELCHAITQDTHYRILAGNLRQELLLNRKSDGTYIPFANADYSAAQLLHLDYYLPDLVTDSALTAMLKVITTPWGCDFDQPAEVYRHWPWIDCHLARAFTHTENPREAFKYLQHWFKYAAATGASPEKIRLDGYAIGYWYPTPYALYLQALYTAFAHIDGQGAIRLLYGFDGTWRDMAARNLRLPGGILVSLSVRNGVIAELDITGNTACRPVIANPIYKA